MKLTISKSKNAEQLYISKSIRVNKNKTTTKTFMKLGTMAELLPKYNNDRDAVIAWAKEEAKRYTKLEKENKLDMTFTFGHDEVPEMDKTQLFNVGYLFLKKIYHQLGIDDICKNISSKHKIDYDLSNILANLIYTRVIYPSSKLSSFEAANTFIEPPKFELHQIYRVLSLLSEHSDEIQAEIYKNSTNIIDRNNNILYYDCTNFFFEIEEEKGIRRYGKSKEHRPNPIVQFGLFMDGNGFPLAFTTFPGNKNEQPSLRPLEEKILKDFNKAKFVVCTDAGLASTSNRKFNNEDGRSFIVTQSLKTIQKHLREWALDPKGWEIAGSDKTYDLNEVDYDKHFNTVFHKERWINENGIEQRFVVSYCEKYKDYQRSIRNGQIERAIKVIEGGKKVTRNQNSAARFIDTTPVTSQGEVAEKVTLGLNEDKISEEEQYDGFYGVCTTLEDDVKDILKVNKQRWQIEAAFRVMKTEFKSRPVYLQRDERIESHFLTCFLALLITFILKHKTETKESLEALIDTLKNMQLLKVKDMGYINTYKRTELTDELNKTFDDILKNSAINESKLKKVLKASEKQ